MNAAEGIVSAQAVRLEDYTTDDRAMAAILVAIATTDPVDMIDAIHGAGLSIVDTEQLRLVMEDVGASYRLAVGGVDKAAEANTALVALREWQRRAVPILGRTANLLEHLAPDMPVLAGEAREIRGLLAEVGS